jgi:hypothetical protein
MWPYFLHVSWEGGHTIEMINTLGAGFSQSQRSSMAGAALTKAAGTMARLARMCLRETIMTN